MGKESWPRITSKETETPGPGAYILPSCFCSGPKYTIQRIHPKKDPENNVGPNLGLSNTNNSPRYHIGTISPSKIESDTPGPSYMPPPMGTDHYRIKYPERNSTTSLPHRRKEIKSNENNGPGDYNIPHLPNEQTAPSFTIGNRPKNDSWLEPNDNPGPLDYSPRVVNDAPKMSIRCVDPPSLNTNTPGPADYPEKPKDKRFAYIHGCNYEPKIDQTPGPGKYTISKKFAENARHCSIRPALQQRNDINYAPYYDPCPTEFTKIKGMTIPRSPRTTRRRETSPGPGAYSPRSTLFSSGHRMPPKKTKDQLEQENKRAQKRYEELPGPASYRINYNSVEKNVPAFSFYGDRVAISTSDSPGPSDYYPKQLKHNSPRYTIRNKDIRPLTKSFTQNAGYVCLKPLDHGPMYSIRPREKLDLIAE